MTASRTTTRPRGYAAWNPRSDTRDLLDNVQAVLDEYRSYLPLTLRQLFYRLVGAHDYPKTEAAYERLTEKINRARRAGLIDWDAIRDDRPTIEQPMTDSDIADFLRRSAMFLDPRTYRRDPREGQACDLWVACEASGMVPMISRAVNPLGVTVVSSGGFDSTTLKRSIAQRSTERPLTVLHVGDHDPSGVHLYRSFAEDVAAFAEADGGIVDFERIAITPDQIEAFDLETAPAKSTDRRAFEGETVQAEALPPDVLVNLIVEAVERHTDIAIATLLLEAERADRSRLADLLAPIRELLDEVRE